MMFSSETQEHESRKPIMHDIFFNFLTALLKTQMTMYWLWRSKTKMSNDLKSETIAMAKAKAESQDHGSHDQSHGKATAKDLKAF